MSTKDYHRDQQLFNSIRQSPTELSLSRVEALIKNIPDLAGRQKVNNNWTYLFNSKNIIMISIPMAIVLSLMIWVKSDQPQTTIPISAETTEEMILELQKDASLTQTTPGSVPSEPQAPDQAIVPQTPEEEVDHLTFARVDTTVEVMNNIPVADTSKTLVFTPSKPKQLLKPRRSSEIKIPKNIIQLAPKPLPELKGTTMRKLKKQLYKNLVADQLIPSKASAVEIQLPGEQVVVNGQVLSPSLTNKYTSLTHVAGVGPDRKIKIHPDYIKVGDFTTEGFNGSALGTFTEKMAAGEGSGGLFMESEEERKRKERYRLIQSEIKERDLFAEKILEDRAAQKGKKKLFSVNLKNKKGQQLFKQLQEMLLKDQLINSSEDFVLIELPKKHIRINGTILNQPLYQKYSTLFSDFKIKSGDLRQIRLSKHTLSAGDFKGESFTGTIEVIMD